MKRTFTEMNNKTKTEIFRDDKQLKIQKIDTVFCDVCDTETNKYNLYGPFAYCSLDCLELLMLRYYK